MGRGPTKAVKKASAYLKDHPHTEAKLLAEKFEIDVSTIYRSSWWLENKAKIEQDRGKP